MICIGESARSDAGKINYASCRGVPDVQARDIRKGAKEIEPRCIRESETEMVNSSKDRYAEA